MGFKLFAMNMDVAKKAQPSIPLVKGVPAVFEHLLPVFSPRRFWCQVDGNQVIDLVRLDSRGAVGTQRLWEGETVSPSLPLTRCTQRPGEILVRELTEALRERTPRTLFVGAEGALRHRVPGTDLPDWYGRWVLDGASALDEVVRVGVQWTEDLHAFELVLPNSGSPLTAARLRADGYIGEGDVSVAAENRALILPFLEGIRESLGLAPGDVRWANDGDYGPLFPVDSAEMGDTWEPRLNGARGT